MVKDKSTDYLFQPVLTIARQDVATVNEDFTVQQALDSIRDYGIGERIVYFYAVDSDARLTGVVPTRRLLTAYLDKKISEIMIPKVITVLESARVMDALSIFSDTKLLALPVVDQQGLIKGVVDIGLFMQEDFDALNRQKTEEVFELIGFHVSKERVASPFQIFKFRFPWLIATIAGGTICAILAGNYDVTLSKSLILAFFLTLVLGLGESVSIQSMAVTIYILRVTRPTWRWYLHAIGREVGASLLLGLGCGLSVGVIAWLWRGTGLEAVAIGLSILGVIVASAFWGLTIPTISYALKLDPKIAAGPLTLAVADICTVLIYFGLASILL